MKASYRTMTLSLACGVALLSGCATKPEVRMVRDEAQAAQRTADQAQNMAREAHQTAQQANRMAQDANARSMNTEEMVNRSFKKSMHK